MFKTGVLNADFLGQTPLGGYRLSGLEKSQCLLSTYIDFA
jgi:hypothetical protein